MKYHISVLDILNSKVKVKIIKFLLSHEASMSEREMASVLKIISEVEKGMQIFPATESFNHA